MEDLKAEHEAQCAALEERFVAVRKKLGETEGALSAATAESAARTATIASLTQRLQASEAAGSSSSSAASDSASQLAKQGDMLARAEDLAVRRQSEVDTLREDLQSSEARGELPRLRVRLRRVPLALPSWPFPL